MPNIPGDIRSYRREGITRTLSFPPEIKIGIIGIADYAKSVNLELSFPLVFELSSEQYYRFESLTRPSSGGSEPGKFYNVFSFIQDNLVYLTRNNDTRVGDSGYNSYASSILDVIEYEENRYVAVVNFQRLSYLRPDPGVNTIWNPGPGETLQDRVNLFPVWERYYPIDLVLLSLYLIGYKYNEIDFSKLMSLNSVNISTITFRKEVLVGDSTSFVEKSYVLNSDYVLSEVRIVSEEVTHSGRNVLAPKNVKEKPIQTFNLSFDDYSNFNFSYLRSDSVFDITLRCLKFNAPSGLFSIKVPSQTLSVQGAYELPM